MRLEFTKDPKGPAAKVADAELYFDADGPLHGLKLVGFSLWKNVDGDVYVTLPARAFGAGTERKYFDFLRSADPHVRDHVYRFKAWVHDEWKRSEGKE